MFNVFAVRRGRERVKDGPGTLNAETSGLTAAQLAKGRRALQVLKLADCLDELMFEDVIRFFYVVGMNPTPDMVQAKLRALKLHGQHSFTWGEVAHVWHALACEWTNEDDLLRRAFQFFDKDGNGEISVPELAATMAELGGLLTEAELAAFLEAMDANEDGAISYPEFLAVLRCQVPQFAGSSERNTEEEVLGVDTRQGGATLPSLPDVPVTRRAIALARSLYLGQPELAAGYQWQMEEAGQAGQEEEEQEAQSSTSGRGGGAADGGGGPIPHGGGSRGGRAHPGQLALAQQRITEEGSLPASPLPASPARRQGSWGQGGDGWSEGGGGATPDDGAWAPRRPSRLLLGQGSDEGEEDGAAAETWPGARADL